MKKFLYLFVFLYLFISVGKAQITEGFESGLTGAYQTGNVTLSSGTWAVTNVANGNSQHHNGSYSLQIKSAVGSAISPNITCGVGTITFWAQGGTLNVQYSTDGGGTWTAITGSPFTLTGSFVQHTATINSSAANILIQFSSSSGACYVDDLAMTCHAASNTVSTGAIATAPFNLAGCGATASGTINFTSTGTFNAGNIYTAYLSDAAGSFLSPISLGSLTSILNSGTINIIIPAGTTPGSSYAIEIISSNPSYTSTATSAFSITQRGCGITTGAVTGAPFNVGSCAGTASGSVAFTSVGTFNAGNIYTAYLSNSSGSFASATNIGTLTSTANSGSVPITIPAGTAAGTGYVIEVVSSNPSKTGTQSSAFTISGCIPYSGPVVVTPTTSATYLAQQIIGPSCALTSASFPACGGITGGSFTAPATFSCGDGHLFTSGVLLTTGDAAAVASAQTTLASKNEGYTYNDANLLITDANAKYDVCALKMVFVPSCSQIYLTFIFGSEEDPKFICGTYNDAMGIYLTGPNPGGGNYSGLNIAVLPNGHNTPVTIDSINDNQGTSPGYCHSAGWVNPNAGYFLDNLNTYNYTDVVWDGFTVPIVATAAVTSGQTYTMEIAVGESGNGLYDSGVAIADNSLSCNVVLPIQLVSFLATRTKGIIMLSWATATETNNDYFEVEYSLDGENFIPYKNVKGFDNSNILRNYYCPFTLDLGSQRPYFRLKQVDYNGNYTFSNIITLNGVTVGGLSGVNSYYEKNNTSIVSEFTLDTPSQINFSLFDITGQVIYSSTNQFAEGDNQFSIPAFNLNGIYILLCQNGNSPPVRKKVMVTQ